MRKFVFRRFRRLFAKTPTDLDPELEGLWRTESKVSEGREQSTELWHYLFRDGIHKEIVPDLVDDGTLRSSYATDLSTNPRRLLVTLDYNGPDGPPDPNPIILRGVYEIDGDKLRITYGLEGEFPKSLSDKFPYSIKTLVRDSGPIPESKKPSGTPPISHDVLGQLNWDDDFDCYQGAIQIGDRPVQIAVHPDDVAETEHVLQRATAIVNSWEHYIRLIQQYAVDGLLELKNDTWLGEDQAPVSSEDFIKTMVLESISVYSVDRVDFWHDDGGLFLGHSIQVSIDAKDRCTLTDIPG